MWGVASNRWRDNSWLFSSLPPTCKGAASCTLRLSAEVSQRKILYKNPKVLSKKLKVMPRIWSCWTSGRRPVTSRRGSFQLSVSESPQPPGFLILDKRSYFCIAWRQNLQVYSSEHGTVSRTWTTFNEWSIVGGTHAGARTAAGIRFRRERDNEHALSAFHPHRQVSNAAIFRLLPDCSRFIFLHLRWETDF